MFEFLEQQFGPNGAVAVLIVFGFVVLILGWRNLTRRMRRLADILGGRYGFLSPEIIRINQGGRIYKVVVSGGSRLSSAEVCMIGRIESSFRVRLRPNTSDYFLDLLPTFSVQCEVYLARSPHRLATDHSETQAFMKLSLI